MKKYAIIFCLILAALSAACTQNSGHIGPLFGSWYLESATCGDEPFALPDDGNTYWMFQGRVLIVKFDRGMYESQERIATWQYAAGSERILQVDFTHSDNNTAPGEGQYTAPEWMGFPAGQVLSLDIESISGSAMTLGWTSPEGLRYTYRFAKTW